MKTVINNPNYPNTHHQQPIMSHYWSRVSSQGKAKAICPHAGHVRFGDWQDIYIPINKTLAKKVVTIIAS